MRIVTGLLGAYPEQMTHVTNLKQTAKGKCNKNSDRGSGHLPPNPSFTGIEYSQPMPISNLQKFVGQLWEKHRPCLVVDGKHVMELFSCVWVSRDGPKAGPTADRVRR